MNVFILIFSVLIVLLAIRDLFMSRPSALWRAWAALAIIRASDVNIPLWSTIIFWGAAAAIALAIGYMLPKNVAGSRVGLGYFIGGAAVGAAVGFGVYTGQAGLIIGTVVGMLIGAMAFSRTPAGKTVATPMRRYANYVLAKGSYVVVNIVIIALTIFNLVLLAKSF